MASADEDLVRGTVKDFVDVVALGASDVVGVGATQPQSEGWAPVMAGLLPGRKRLMRLGLSGATAAELRHGLLARAVAARPDVAVLWTGVNDFARQLPLGGFQVELDHLVGGLAGTGARVFVLNLPDVTRLPAVRPFASALAPQLAAWQGAVRQAAGRHRAHVIELAPFSDEIIRRPDFVSADGFHPSTAGHRRVAEVVAAAVTAML